MFKRTKELEKKVRALENRIRELASAFYEKDEKNKLYTNGYGLYIPTNIAVNLLADKLGVTFEWEPSTGPNYKLKEKGGNTR